MCFRHNLLCLALCPSAAAGLHLISETLYSQPIRVNSSGIAFREAIPLKFPQGHLAITGITSDFVDERSESVPISQAYMHHWFVNALRKTDGGVHSIATFGAGAEFRNVPEEFDSPTAVITHGDEQWIAQLHVIDLRLANAQDRLPCLECRRRVNCADGSCLDPNVKSFWPHLYNQYKGGIYACNWDEVQSTAGSGYCTSPQGRKDLPTASYRLKYTVTYARLETTDSTPWVPIHGFTLKAEDPYAEYTVPSCATDGSNPMCVHVLSSEWVVSDGVIRCLSCPHFDPQLGPGSPSAPSGGGLSSFTEAKLPFKGPLGLVWATGHQHDGALGMELWMLPPGSNTTTKIFTSEAMYGSQEGVAGDELGFVVGNTIGRWTDPIVIPEGAHLIVKSKYDAHPPAYNTTGFVAGAEVARTGVMGYMRMRVIQLEPHLETAVRFSSQQRGGM